MDFRRSGSRDERRRRVLLDDTVAEPPSEETPAATKRGRGKSEGGSVNAPYAPAALGEGQPRIADLLPLRRLTLWMWLLAALLFIGPLAFVQTQLAGWRQRMPNMDFAALDLNERGNVGSWFTSVVLAWAAFASVQVYLLRRHRSDDYRGGYRLWLWCAGALTVASALAATNLHELAGAGSAYLLGSPDYAEPIGRTLLAVLGGGLMARMAWEIRASRGAVAALVGSFLAYTTAGVVLIDAVASLLPAASVVGGASVLLAHCLVLMTIGAFGRYVSLEARGRIVQRPQKKKVQTAPEKTKKERPAKPAPAAAGEQANRPDTKKRTPKAEPQPDKTESRPAKSETAVTKPTTGPNAVAPKNPPVKSTPAKPSVSAPQADDDDLDDDEVEGAQQMSKAQKRQLRKQQKRQNQRAA